MNPPAPPQPSYSAPAPQMQPAPMQGPPMPPPTQSGKVPGWVWAIVAVFGLFVLIGIGATIALRMVVHHVAANPALAMAKLITAGNPDVEVVGSDSRGNTVTFRDKKTGETVTMNFDDIKKGRIQFKGNKGEVATIDAHGSGESGTLSINGPNGSMQFGAGADAKIPSWVPVYPGVTPVGTFSMQGADGTAGSYQFATKDSAQSVLSHYEGALKQAGFKINGTINGNSGASSGGMVSGEEESTKHSVVVTVGNENGDTRVNVMFATKK
jgi:hypothetical protein